MLRYILKRPIAVIMVLTAWLAVSIVSFFQLPVSLLPDIDVPEITISVALPNSPPADIEQNILKPIREQMMTVAGMKHLESVATQESGLISIYMNYGVNMNLAYIEINEKIDQLISQLPATLPRPQVIRSNTTDIPVARIQLVPNDPNDHIHFSSLARNILKRRLEQIDGVGLVDINGVQQREIRVAPDYARLQQSGISELELTQAIEKANVELSSLAVRDGNYTYYIKLGTRLLSVADIKKLPIHIPGSNSVITLAELANFSEEPARIKGFHLFNNHDAIVITVHKQADARMPEVMPLIYETVDQFTSDYREATFSITQDQSELLTLSIDNLSQTLIWGGLFAFAVLFVFMKGWREPLVMGIILPISLLLSFSLLTLLGVSLNIISLSGLVLGLGMLVDNSIVVIDNIALKRRTGESLLDSCVVATEEVIPPLVSSSLTNLAVFIPLIFISGITGALFFDQAMAVISILFVSLVCTFIAVPMLYLLLNRNERTLPADDSKLMLWLKRKYHQSFMWVWQHKVTSLITFSLLIGVFVILITVLPKEGFPAIERSETLVLIDWNEPIDIQESKKRVKEFCAQYQQVLLSTEAEVGFKQFMLTTSQHTAQQVELYLKYTSPIAKARTDRLLKLNLSNLYPAARINLLNTPNAFEQLFISKRPVYEVRLRDLHSEHPLTMRTADSLIKLGRAIKLSPGKGFETETMATLELDHYKVQLYRVKPEDVHLKLRILFGAYPVTSLDALGETTPVLLASTTENFERALRVSTIQSDNGKHYYLNEFVTVRYEQSYKNITADADGVYQSLVSEVAPNHDVKPYWSDVTTRHGIKVDFSGTILDTEKQLNQLLVILIVSLILMYFIITAEFESFTQPLLVMFSIPIGFAGSMLLLWFLGGSINVMSGIGLVVVLGILDNDAILKIDRINTYRKTLPLHQAIEQAGLDRFKPIVMNTCTNVLALMPLLFSSGLGADLQRPIAITTIGGLVVATFTALYFIPILYWFTQKDMHQESNPHLTT